MSHPKHLARFVLLALLANLLIMGLYGYYLRLSSTQPDLFYRSVQEDETLEWGTFWAFALAAGVFALAARQRRRVALSNGWFLWAVSLFCFCVAMEEISWGQRLLGFRPPAYFLAHNYQQELNLHNVASQAARTFGIQSALLGYGVLLPLLGLWSAASRVLKRVGIVPAPAFLIPAFLLTSYLHWSYPLKFTGEIVEMMLGLGFLFSGLLGLRRGAPPDSPLRHLPAVLPVLGGFVLAMGLGEANASISRGRLSGNPVVQATARHEIEALKKDFLTLAARQFGKPITSCNLSKRLYSYVTQYDEPGLLHGDYAALTAKGMPSERAEFFLDPWNSPWWIRDWCNEAGTERRIFVYSFGPNRRRDSTQWDILGDDIGAFIYKDPPGGPRRPGQRRTPDATVRSR